MKVTKKNEILCWHFLPENRKLAYAPHTPVIPGSTMREDRPLSLCHVGLHASRKALDALQFAHSAILCRTVSWGETVEGPDKLCSSRRTVLWMVDATKALHEFACTVATRALERERAAGREPDKRSWAAIDAKRRWLKGEITDEDLAAARDAARAAAGDAARDAARAAARDAARAAAWDAARDAARVAAWDAAWVAARDAARAAARAAARDAARDAETQWQTAEFERLCLSLEPKVGGR